MLNISLGIAALAVTVAGFWTVRPVDGKLNPRLGPLSEIWIAVGLVGTLALGIGLIIAGIVPMLTSP